MFTWQTCKQNSYGIFRNFVKDNLKIFSVMSTKVITDTKRRKLAFNEAEKEPLTPD